ncbi:MAG: TlpA family protein disulfide reductase [Acidobacteria bacterium]|nr:TlpA family protein disulfide reductase [Acidobacteriota bacterium]
MLESGHAAPQFVLPGLDGTEIEIHPGSGGCLYLLVFFETDCPTCRLTFPYLNTLAGLLEAGSCRIIGVSQDSLSSTREFVDQMEVSFPVLHDGEWKVTRAYDPLAVPTIFLIGQDGNVAKTQIAFDKKDLNEIAGLVLKGTPNQSVTLAGEFDGNPASKPGCTSRHLETMADGDSPAALNLYARTGARSSKIELGDDVDPIEYCLDAGFDPLPVVPPTIERVERMLGAVSLPPDQVIARIPPNYGEATVEKIAAAAVMAGCKPEMMKPLITLTRAVCDERFNIHGVQATTHFAAPLVIVNGPIRKELGFASGSNVLSNVARANSTLGRALQLMLLNIGGARPGEMDMSTLGNPGKFSYCIAENEEENPWEPFHVEQGFRPDQSTVTLFAAEPPRGVSEHNARKGRTILRAICQNLTTIFGYRRCMGFEAFVVICPEHVRTLQRDGFDKDSIRRFLFDYTGIPLRAFDDDDGEGVQYLKAYEKITIDGEPCYRKFAHPSQIRIIVAGGTAGKFSAVIGSWATGTRGSQVVTYPIE